MEGDGKKEDESEEVDIITALSGIRDHMLALDGTTEWLWMHVVALIPEEVDRKELKLATAERQLLRQVLRDNSAAIVAYGLERMDSRENPSLFQACVRVCNAWVAGGFAAFDDLAPVISHLIAWIQRTAAEAVNAGTDMYLDEDVMFTRVNNLLITCTETFTTAAAVTSMGEHLLSIADGCHHYLSLARLVRSFACHARLHLFTCLQAPQWQLLLDTAISCTSNQNPRIADEMVLLWSTLPETLKVYLVAVCCCYGVWAVPCFSPSQSYTDTDTQTHAHTHTHSLSHSLTYLFTHPLTHSPTHPLTHSPTHPPTHRRTH